ncbi:MAG: hypothetical protein KatS3mg029_0887 [Saprospiraceae bacterium]|nr:MAG: hypothetical protein KatS3mg029_0887 [Saprospiraceae bacterium]
MSRLPIHVILIIGWLCLPFCSYGQWEGMRFFTLAKEQGLSSNQVNQILQDQKGYMWFGTADGLNRFDGKQVKVFRFEPTDSFSISSGEIHSLKQSEDGIIWVGTQEGFLNTFIPEEGRFYRYAVPRDEVITHTSVWDIAPVGDSLVFLGLERGLARFDRRTKQFAIWRPSVENPALTKYWHDVIYTIAPDPADPDVIWLGARGGLLKYHIGQNRFSLAFPRATHRDLMAIQDFQFEGDSLIWMAAGRGSIVCLNRKKGDWKTYTSQYPTPFSTTFLLPLPDGNFGVGFYNLGLAHFRKSDGRFFFVKDASLKIPPLPDGACYAGYVDDDGRIWAGTENGVFWTDPVQQMFRHYRFDPEEASFPDQFFAKDLVEIENGSKYLVAPLKGKGLYVIEKSSGRIVRSVSPPEKGAGSPNAIIVLSMLKDRHGVVWVATEHGLFQVDASGKRLVNPPGLDHPVVRNAQSKSLKEDSKGNIYYLTSGPLGMARISADRQTFRHFTHENSSDAGFPKVESLYELALDARDDPWLFGQPYLVKYDAASGQFLTKSNCIMPGGLSSCWVYSGEVDAQGRAWIGYNSAGLDCFDPSQQNGEQVRNFRIADGLPGEKVMAIAKDGNNYLWLATNNGLSRLDLNSHTFRNFSMKDGLIRDDLGFHWVASLKVLESGGIFIGGHGFFSILDPRKIPENKPPPRIVLNELFIYDSEKLLDTSLEYARGIVLQPDENFFTITFAALEFTKPEQLRYRFRLMGFDRSWRESREGKATYTDVPPGQYTFRVEAAYAGSDWTEEGRTLAITVLPPFYATWWFRLLMASLLGFGVLLLHKWRIRRVKEQASLKAAYERRLMDVELKALRAQMNPHFLFNSLNSIKNYIVQNEPKLAARYLTKFSQLMRLILNNSKNEVVTLKDELKALELYLELERLRFGHKFEFEFDIEPGLPIESIEIPPLVLQPFVENAIWHGLVHKEGNGMLWVRVQRQNGMLKVEVEDNGVGRERARKLRSKTATKRKGMGMQITSDRLSMVKSFAGERSTIRIEDLVDADGQPAGTLVVIKIPL